VVRERWAGPDIPKLFVAMDNRTGGTGMTARAICYLVDGYLEELGLKAEGISCDALPHSTATWARFGGAKLDAIGDILGHASVDTTRVYSKIVDRMKEYPARYLEELMG
jgi:site-specific recombinase XerD